MQLKKGLILQQAQLKKRTDELLTNGSTSSQKMLEEGASMNGATTKGHSMSSIFWENCLWIIHTGHFERSSNFANFDFFLLPQSRGVFVGNFQLTRWVTMSLVNLFPALLSWHWSAWCCNVLMINLFLSFVHGFEVLNNQVCCPSKFSISLRIC